MLPEAITHKRMQRAVRGNLIQHNGHVLRRRNAALGEQVYLSKRDDAACRAGGFYKSPLATDKVDVDEEVAISWDKTCLDKSLSHVDIYLYAPSAHSKTLPVHKWQGVDNKHGAFSASINPAWWGAQYQEGTGLASLQFTIVPTGNEVWDSANPAGPIFASSYNGTLVVPLDASKATLLVENFWHKVKKITGAQTAAAVIMPLLAVGALIGFFVLRHFRRKTDTKRQRWSVHMDKRMSAISGDWKQGGPGKKNGRESSFYDAQRQPSTYSDARPEMQENTPGMSLYGEANMGPPSRAPFMASNRQSMISFADKTKGDRVGEMKSPGLPRIGTQARDGPREFDDYGQDLSMSPTQAEGASPLTPRDINARVQQTQHGQSHENTSAAHFEGGDQTMASMLAMPAVAMLRTGRESESSDGHSANSSAMSTGLPVPPLGLSPDDAMRQYAASRALASPTTSGPPTTMRTLYSPNIVPPPNAATSNPFHASGPSNADAYGLTHSGQFDHDPTYHQDGHAFDHIYADAQTYPNTYTYPQ